MSLKKHSLAPAKAEPEIDVLEGMPEMKMIALRRRIDDTLGLKLNAFNLEAELSLQYRQGMILLAEIQADVDTPANQKAQVFNSVSAMLRDIAKFQATAYNVERSKRFEAAVLRTLQAAPPEMQRVYFDSYREFLEDAE